MQYMLWTEKTEAIADSWDERFKCYAGKHDTASYHWKVLSETIEEMVDNYEDCRKEGTVFSPPNWFDANPNYSGATLKEWKALAWYCRSEEALYAKMARRAEAWKAAREQ